MVSWPYKCWIGWVMKRHLVALLASFFSSWTVCLEKRCMIACQLVSSRPTSLGVEWTTTGFPTWGWRGWPYQKTVPGNGRHNSAVPTAAHHGRFPGSQKTPSTPSARFSHSYTFTVHFLELVMNCDKRNLFSLSKIEWLSAVRTWAES